jgi:hypothetical protein
MASAASYCFSFSIASSGVIRATETETQEAIAASKGDDAGVNLVVPLRWQIGTVHIKPSILLRRIKRQRLVMAST